ncbi:hypothetical protein VE02_07370 [Pseudogymnoascus sp. 03VT05]|nr:hypothetical protein VE02_07370 [Pseudogymnoascus sp. 03VT05]
MKYSIVFIGALATFATAQSVTDLSQCGQTCVKSMLAQAATLGCTTTDAACLCNKRDFAYGIRDCANEACGSDAPKIIAYGTAFCKGNNGGSDSGASSSGSGASAGSGSATGTDASSTATATDGAGAGGAVGGGAGASGSGASGSGAHGAPVPITTSAVVSDSKTVGSTTIYSSDASATPVTTVTSDGKAVTTLYGAVGGANGGSGSGSGSSGAGGDMSTVTSGSSTFVTTASSVSGSASTSDSGNGGAAGGAGSSSTSGSGTSTSSAGGARQTAAAAGVMAVAGLAAFVL